MHHSLQHETQHSNEGLQRVHALSRAQRQYGRQLCQGCESGAGAAAPGTGAGDARTRPSLGRKRGMPSTTGYATAHSSQTSSDATGSHLRKRARTGPTVCKSTRGGAVRQQVCGRLGAQQVCLPHRWRSPERRLGDGADEVVQQLCVKVYPRSAW